MYAEDIINLIYRRFAEKVGTEWVLATEVSDSTGVTHSYSRVSRLDAIAVSCWRSSRYAVHGFEVKVSRSDFLREIADPDKRARFEESCNQFWFACAPDVAEPAEVPDGCGLLVATKNGSKLVRKVTARYYADRSPDDRMWRSIVRASAKNVAASTRYT
jgi:hypothetical protein